MTAKTTPLTAALPEALHTVLADTGFGLLLGSCFQTTWHIFWNDLSTGKFSSFDSGFEFE